VAAAFSPGGGGDSLQKGSRALVFIDVFYLRGCIRKPTGLDVFLVQL
jgi:hypothetical protein